MEQLFARFIELIESTDTTFVRYLYSQINWDNRLISIIGSRGVGKTTMLFQHIKKNYDVYSNEVLYVSLDNIWFSSHSLLELADDFNTNGGRVLFLDEVHKYPTWAQEIKNIYDSYPKMKVVFTGSSMLNLQKSDTDLSRRVVKYTLEGMSLREFLEFEYNYKVEALGLDDLLKNHSRIAGEIVKSIKPIVAFKEYLRYGYFPYYKESKKEEYYGKLLSTINTILEVDLPSAKVAIEYATVMKIKKLFSIISAIVPFTPNISELAGKVETTRTNLPTYLKALETAKAIILLSKQSKGIKQLSKPEKIYLGNTNYAFAFAGEKADIGNVRETFFVSLVSVVTSVAFSENGDFLVDDKYTIEVGGKDKDSTQIKGIPNSYLAKDNIEIGFGNQIPLWMFGLLY